MSPGLLHLAIDTSTSRPAVAFLSGPNALHEWIGPEGLRHHETLLRGVDECLRQTEFSLKDLAFLSVGVGPGMFTGLRIGITTAKFLADPLDLPCVAVSSLVALASQEGPAEEGSAVWALSDARSRRVYALRMERGTLGADASPPPEEEVAMSPEEVAKQMRPGDLLVGEGAALYADQWPAGIRLAESHSLRAAAVGRLGFLRYGLGLTLSATELAPKYLKTGQAHL
jgi:tRNA threonylcarbamoyladenosine biosynthesis protein TsaB